MKRTSVLARNFYRRPVVRALVPDLKNLLAVLTVGCESHVGCWVPVGLGEDAGLDISAVEGGLKDLEKRGLIMCDKETGEVFLKLFFRDNKFSGEARHRQAMGDFEAVLSPFLKEAIVAAVRASPECYLSPELFCDHQLINELHSKGKEKRKGKNIRSAPSGAQLEGRAVCAPPHHPQPYRETT